MVDAEHGRTGAVRHHLSSASLMQVCIEPGCGMLTKGRRCTRHESQRQRTRNADPKRIVLYKGDWPAESRRIRAEQPWCSVCYSERDLTVDHPTRAVLCRSHHARLEARRRRDLSAASES